MRTATSDLVFACFATAKRMEVPVEVAPREAAEF